MLSNPVEYHIGTFMRTLTSEVTHALRRMARTGLIAFLLVLIGGGIIVTLVVFDVGKTPLRPLAELSYAVLVVAALATGAAAAALHLSVAILRAIERASKRVVQEIDEIEGNAVRSLLGVTPDTTADAASSADTAEPSQQPQQ